MADRLVAEVRPQEIRGRLMASRTLVNRVIRKIKRVTNRQLKRTRQRFLFPKITTYPVFIIGTQRSGTNMLMNMLDMSLDVYTYNEDNATAFKNYRIRDRLTREKLLNRAHCKWIAFKPICDLQHSVELLDSHTGSKAIWIFRDYRDVANSAIKLWGREQYDHIERLVTQDDCSHWFCESVGSDVREVMRHFYERGISDHEAGVLKWYVRNHWFFSQDLVNREDQVLLVNYEHLVTDSAAVGQRVFDFLGIEFHSPFVHKIHRASVRKDSFPEINQEIESLCRQLMDRLEQVAESR